MAAAWPIPPDPDSNWALFFDLDGTLIDLAPRPDMVRMPEMLIDLLKQVQRELQGALAVVSGRPLGQLDALLAPWRPPAAGEHGAQCRLPSGEMVPPPRLPAVPTEWRLAADALASENAGIVVEQKATGIAVHYRQAPGSEGRVRDVLQRLAAQRPREFTAMPGLMLTEIRPRAVDKGSAVEWLMREKPFAGRTPVFVGDDVTDEDGFRAAEALGGRGLHVHRHFSGGAAQVREWLVEMLQTLQAR